MSDSTEPKLQLAKDQIPSNEPKLVESEDKLATNTGSAEPATPVRLISILTLILAPYRCQTYHTTL